jgi:hypothetical protein
MVALSVLEIQEKKVDKDYQREMIQKQLQEI